MKLSLISPSRNNLKYLKWSYESVRKHAPADIEYCVASDFSDDGTVEWCEETAKKDPNFKYIVNEGPGRLGHTILYDKLIEEVATGDIVMIWHSDMYLTPGSLEKVIQYFVEAEQEALGEHPVVSMTRIEPPLHPPGPEKIVADFGTEPEDFDEQKFIKFVDDIKPQYTNKISQGMFAPWAILREDFLAINGHDPLYAPQSREDSDIFNRFILAGYKPVQMWNTFVYHMTCRGSRFNPRLTRVGQASDEWLAHNKKSERNFTRKWGHMVKVDENMKPIIPHKYDITFVAGKCNKHLLELLEPWCTRIYCDDDYGKGYITEYIEKEQPNTMYDLTKRVLPIQSNPLFPTGDVIVEFDPTQLNEHNFRDVITQLSSILDQVEEPGEYEFDIFNVNIKKIKYYENDLIVCDKTKIIR